MSYEDIFGDPEKKSNDSVGSDYDKLFGEAPSVEPAEEKAVPVPVPRRTPVPRRPSTKPPVRRTPPPARREPAPDAVLPVEPDIFPAEITVNEEPFAEHRGEIMEDLIGFAEGVIEDSGESVEIASKGGKERKKIRPNTPTVDLTVYHTSLKEKMNARLTDLAKKWNIKAE